MHNVLLEYLLKNAPEKVMSKGGYRFRRFISPLVRNVLGPATSKNTYHIDRRSDLPTDRSLIFACTHQVKDDIALALASAGSLLMLEKWIEENGEITTSEMADMIYRFWYGINGIT